MRPASSAILAGIKISYALSISAAIYLRIHGAVFPILLPAILIAAIVWGGWEERVVIVALAFTLVVLAIGPWLRIFPHSFDVAGSRLGVILVGSLYLTVLAGVAVWSEKWWPSWVTAFQFLLVLSHPLFVVLRDQIEPWAYASGIVIWSWLQLIALGCGVLDCWWQRPPQEANCG